MTAQCKGDELEASRNIIAKLAPLNGTVLTLDALHCDQHTCNEIVEDAGGNYLIGVKGNVKSIKKRMVKLIDESHDDEFIDKEEKVIHGRKEVRVTSVRSIVPEDIGLPHAHSIIRVIRYRSEIRKGKKTSASSEIAYYVSSLMNLNAVKANRLVRDHWSIENRLHYIKDVTQLEDQCTLNNGLARILAAARSLAVVVLRGLKGTLPMIQRRIASKPNLAIDFMVCKELSKSKLQSLK